MENFTSVLIQLELSGKSGLPYNTYIPYLSFVFISGIYLLLIYKSFFSKIVLLLVNSFIFGVILFSTSRQTVLFCFIACLGFLIIQRSKIKLIISLCFVLGITYYLITFSDVLFTLYFSPKAVESERFSIMNDGLQKLNGYSDWLFGKGFTSVVFSGPHNNYIRVLQRIGIFGVVLTFAPFIYAFISLAIRMIKYWNNKIFDRNLAWFLTMAIFFTLFHSFFGYPHADAFCTPFVWLGLSLYMILNKNLIYFKSIKVI